MEIAVNGMCECLKDSDNMFLINNKCFKFVYQTRKDLGAFSYYSHATS